MQSKKLLLTAAFLTSCALSPALWACSGMGSSTHAGKVMSIDESMGTFTIMDLQTMSPVTFSADEKIMRQIMGVDGIAIVEYTSNGAGLTATEVELQ